MLEYGVDAYDMVRRAENEELQAEWTRRLARELEANAVTCEAGCASNVASGGTIMSWVDEYYKGHLNTNACARGGDTPGEPRCECGWSSAGSDACPALAASGGAPAVTCLESLNRAQCVTYWQARATYLLLTTHYLLHTLYCLLLTAYF